MRILVTIEARDALERTAGQPLAGGEDAGRGFWWIDMQQSVWDRLQPLVPDYGDDSDTEALAISDAILALVALFERQVN